ncbi:non-ribosomal peptide synthetase [Streptomyces tateyamensis]|uniref:Non-ribosomal peptide synthetase n=1 Tax=Streptomyces tateyamensis TaxID=565073 RepID=A0A2V4NPG0_9ACTN|nr:non-ribosomal peptide synthetase [Streptomyces tateyamensis]PYC87463.1 non-ribosomal peptide synthetase [Streptomyces tateyamensis]
MTETVVDRAALRQELLRRRLSGTAPAAPREDGIRRAPRSGPLPLSFAQRRLWILDQLQPGGTEYLMTAALRLSGELDRSALRTALDALVARHEVLRTCYPLEAGEPVQLIGAPAPLPLTELDLTGLDREAAWARLAALATWDRTPVDLARGPVCSATLARMAEEEHALLLTVHHIASDGWSEELLVRQLTRGYADAVAGRSVAAEGSGPQYADFARWQRERLSGDLLERQSAYWKQRLAGLPPLELPTDRPRPPVRDTAGGQVPLTVPAEVVRRLNELARAQGATAFMTLLAAHSVLLGRWTGQRDLAVGTPVAGRDRPEVQELVGLFLNTLVLRTDLSGAPSFAEVVRRVRATALDAYAHQDLPFEQLVDALVPERDPSRNPLFATMLLWQDGSADGAPQRAGGLLVEPLPVGESSAKVELTVGVAEQPDGSLAGGVTYASALFDRGTAERFAAQLVQLLHSAVADPERPIDELEVLPAAERELVLRGWNDTARPYPTGTLATLFEAQAARTPQAPAVRFEGTELSYRELDEQAEQLARRLRARGVGPESVVGVCLHRGPGLVAALLGILKAGGAYLPLDPDYPAQRLAYMLADSGARLVVTDPELAPAGAEPVYLDAAEELPQPLPAPVPAGPGHPAYVIYTSGSTGNPKGVLVEHRAIVNRLHWMQQEYGLTAADRVLQKTPYSFDVSVWEFFWPLTTGATLVVLRPGGHRDPAEIARVVAAEQVSTLHFVPSMLRAFLAHPLPELPTLRRLVCSGEALTGDLVEAVHAQLDCELHNLYGPTEAAVDVTAIRCEPGTPVTIGRPIANTRCYLVDRELRPVPIGVPGELLLGGVQLARGYLNRAALTAERFVPSPFEAGRRLYRTGDLARWRPDGTIEYLGRLDHQVKIRGQRVELGEIEAALTELPGIAAAAVTVHQQQLVAHLAPGTADPEQAREQLRRRLPAHLVPVHWTLQDALPLTPSGKVDRKALPEPGGTRAQLGGDYLAPRDELEQAMAQAFAEALGLDRVGVQDSFFQLGGDSMRAIRVVGALREQGIELAVHDLFTRQRVAELAALVRTEPAARTAQAAPVAPFEQLTEADRKLLPPGLVDAYPMAQTQAGMVYELLAGADQAVYHNVSCYRVGDDLPFDPATMHAAAALLTARHEILRTSFDLSTYGEPLQLVHESAELPVGLDDLRALPEADRQAVLDGFLLAERRRRFDLDRPPLLRYHVHLISDQEWLLTHTECHAILDGWSHTSAVAELLGLYRTLRRGGTPAFPPPPPARFADFVALERAALASPADRAFWAEAVTGRERFELPAGWAGGSADEKATILDVPYQELLPGLRRLAAAAGGSLKSVLHAAHLKALGLVTGRRRFFGGLVCNGRPEQARGDEVLGLYLNTVPFAAELSAPTWRALVAEVFAGEAALWPHRRFPMPAMQREWGSSEPLIEVAFGYLDFHVLDWESGEVTMVDDFSPSELALEVWTFPGVLRLGARPDRVGRRHLELLARCYRHVLEAMAADPDGDAAALTLPPADLAAAVRAGNDAAPPAPVELLVPELVAAAARATPTATALRRGTQTVGYAELDARANRLAHRLGELGVTTESVVGLHLPRTPELFVALLAVLRAGGAFLPLDPAYPADRLRHMLDDARAAVVLSTPELADRLPAHLADRVEVLDESAYLALPEQAPVVPLHPDQLAYVIYTSGSTGLPKGVGVPHRGALNLRQAQLAPLRVAPGDRVLQFASPSFDASVWEVLMALTNGAELVLPPPDTDPGDLRRQAPLVTHMTLPPSLLERLDPADFPQLKLLVSAGEACPAEQAARWARHTGFVNAYGPTETSVCATLTPVAADDAGRTPSIGRPIEGVRCYVLDESGQPLPEGVAGELCVGGAGVARGYLGRAALTAERFVPDPYGEVPGGRLYRTGDLVRREADGALRYLGRRDHQVKVRGLRVEPGEIEHLLLEHPAVAAAAVTAHRAGTAAATLVAYVKAVPGQQVGAAELRAHLRGRIPQALVPGHFLTVAEFPLTPAGKVDRAKLPAPEGDRPQLATAYTAPSGELECALAEAWAEALEVTRVGAQDDFFELGGHSLAMMRIVATLRARHGVELRFSSFIEHRTVAALAASLGAGAEPAEDRDTLVWLRREGTRTPLFCVHPGGGSAHWYLRLAPQLAADRPVAAFEWPGPHSAPTAPSAEQVAERYLAELRGVQPSGPYLLFSWCGGSGIATELAQRLRAAGEQVTFLLLDPGVDMHQRGESWRELGKIRRLEQLLVEIDRQGSAADTPERRQEILDLLDHLVDDVDEETGISLPEQGVGSEWPRAARVWREVMEMDLAYRHRPYEGGLHLVVSDELAQGEHEVAYGQAFEEYLARWRELATGGVTVHRVPGDHFGVMKPPHVATLGAVIEEVLGGR